VALVRVIAVAESGSILESWAAARMATVRVVLVATSHPGNIGAVARAMRTMGLSQLHLVTPHADPLCEEALVRASGAERLLRQAVVHDTLDEALAPCGLVLGASARMRNLPWPALGPRQCAQQVARLSTATPVALVFGRERSGLSNAELERCGTLLHIPADPDFSSLNLAAAVQICAYELRTAMLSEQAPGAVRDEPATTAALEGFYTHLRRVLVQSGFLQPARPGRVMRRLRRLLARAGPERTEIDILRGILTAVEAAMTGRGAGQRDSQHPLPPASRKPPDT
jgi:TrmH family RNA methyltransferase